MPEPYEPDIELDLHNLGHLDLSLRVEKLEKELHALKEQIEQARR